MVVSARFLGCGFEDSRSPVPIINPEKGVATRRSHLGRVTSHSSPIAS
jgi:hypothetical protein